MLENLTKRKSFSEMQMAKILTANTVVSDHKKIKLVFYIKGLEKGQRKKPYVRKYFPLFSYKLENVQCLI